MGEHEVEGSEIESPFADLGVPTAEDYERAEGWRKARADWSPIWLLLSDEQQKAVNRRLRWVSHFDHTRTGETDG